MRLVGVIAWGLTLAGSLVFLWFGVFRTLTPTQTETVMCVGFDRPWFVAGVLVNLAAAGIALAALRAGWWALGIALPALVAIAVEFLFPCSFLLLLLLPVAALVALAFAVVVIVRRSLH